MHLLPNNCPKYVHPFTLVKLAVQRQLWEVAYELVQSLVSHSIPCTQPGMQ